MRKKTKQVITYIIPITLWSVVVTSLYTRVPLAPTLAGNGRCAWRTAA